MIRRLIVLCLFSLALLAPAYAIAGPYLNTSSMLLRDSCMAAEWVRANIGDRELAKAAQAIAAARVDVASRMTVPPEVKTAHPHLLLSLTNMERAFEAASQGQISTFMRMMYAAQGEVRTFETVLSDLGFQLPKGRCGRCAEHALIFLRSAIRRSSVLA